MCGCSYSQYKTYIQVCKSKDIHHPQLTLEYKNSTLEVAKWVQDDGTLPEEGMLAYLCISFPEVRIVVSGEVSGHKCPSI